MSREALVELLAKVEAGEAVGHYSPPFKNMPRVDAVICARLCYEADRKGSLDAAKALMEAVLPGWSWRVASCWLSDDAFVFPDFNCPVHGERLKKTVPVLVDGVEWSEFTDIDQRPAGNPARAWLRSILKALIAEAEE